jgi:DNA-binding LacI/PurR family transcriptional regulator
MDPHVVGRPAVMHDVARLAGVSHQTVSRVLNGQTNVREETRLRVLQAVEKLSYRPNAAARALVTRRTRRIGVVTSNMRLFGPASALLGIDQAARERGYTVSVTSTEGMDAAQTRDALNEMADQSVDGIIVIAPSEGAARVLHRLPGTVPVVAVEAAYSDDVPLASVDQVTGARLATEHLLGLGHRRVLHVSGPTDWGEARERIEGWRAALSAADRVAPPVLTGDWSAASGYRAAAAVAEDPSVTAVFAANDHMALGLLSGLHEHRVRVPQDVSVVGFDDIPEAEYMVPALTTVHQPFDEVGRRGMQMLIAMIDAPEAGSEVSELVEPTLVVRRSTAPGPVDRRR